MTTTLISTLQEIIREEMRGLRLAETGVVEKTYPHADASDEDNYACDVRLLGSDLVLKKVPVSTGHIGTAAIPNVGDLVLLVFEQGDVNQPFIIGRLYTDTERPPINRNDEIIFRLPLQKDDAKTITAAIRNIDSREMLLEMPSKIKLQVVDDAMKLTAGQTEMFLEQPGGADGVATLHAGRTIITVNQDGDLTIEAAGDITLKTSTGDVKIEGKSITLKSTMDTKIEAGMQASVKGGISASLEGSANASVKGGMISISGMTTFSPA
jgi:hypothetical protein